MKFNQKLKKAILIKRYKRFLADVKLDNGDLETIYCPNTGSMSNCMFDGGEIWYSTSDNPKRKYKHTWELSVSPQNEYIGINTMRANGVVREAIDAGLFPEFGKVSRVRSECVYGSGNSRIDFIVDGSLGEWFVEVKSVTLNLGGGQGCFPDAKSIRAVRHLHELIGVLESGQKAALVYCVQHSGITSVRAADHIDPTYAEALQQAVAAGLQVYALACTVNEHEISGTCLLSEF